MTDHLVTQALAFKKAFFARAKILYAADTALRKTTVLFGWPGSFLPKDIVALDRIRTKQDPASLSPRRSRNDDITLEVISSAFVAGGSEADEKAWDAAFARMHVLEQYVRDTDTTVDGTVEYCFLDQIDEAESNPVKGGRNAFVRATFAAHSRISGRTFS